MKRFHFWATVTWMTLGLGISIAFPASVPWVNAMSLWANVVGHWSAYQAARAEMKAGNDSVGKGWMIFHLVATLAWVSGGSLITVLLSGSVSWLIFMSLWANVVGHWSAYQASRAEDAAS